MLHGKSFHVLRGPVLIPIVLVIAAVTAASFFLNAVFGFAIVQSGIPRVRPALAQARSHLAVILGSGAVVGLLLGLSTMVVTRWGRPWFAISLSVVKPTASRRDKLTASVVGGAVGAVVCTPPYLLGRVGLLILGSRALLIPGIVVLALGATLQAGTTGGVKAVKMSAKLVAQDGPKLRDAAVPGDPSAQTEVGAPVRDETAAFLSPSDRRDAR